MFFSFIRIYLFIFLTSWIFIPLLVFSLLRYSLLVTALLCLVTPPIVWAVQWGAGWRGGRINEVFLQENVWQSAKTSGRNNEVTVLPRWP